LLTEQIQAGVYRPGRRFPSERVLAREFGVSRTSVRETMAQLISDGILTRTVGRGAFVTDRGKTNAAAMPEPMRHLGFWISTKLFNFVQSGYTRILTSAAEASRVRGYLLQFHAVNELDQPLEAVFAGDISSRAAGNLVVGGLNRLVLDRLRKLPSPLLLVDLLVSDETADSVRIDYAGGTRQALEHLAALGHRTIGFIGFPNSQKYEAYWQSLEALKLQYNPRFAQFLSISDLVPGALAGYNSMQKLIAGHRLPTALLVTNDVVVLGVMQALANAGIRVPDKISVVGYDDLGLSARPLTTIQADLTEVGRLSANVLIDRIQNGVELPQQPLVVPVKLVVRDTTAPPR
jgi:GntR family transcriptional regulator, arabinose operon transcriptional repressor